MRKFLEFLAKIFNFYMESKIIKVMIIIATVLLFLGIIGGFSEESIILQLSFWLILILSLGVLSFVLMIVIGLPYELYETSLFKKNKKKK